MNEKRLREMLEFLTEKLTMFSCSRCPLKDSCDLVFKSECIDKIVEYIKDGVK